MNINFEDFLQKRMKKIYDKYSDVHDNIEEDTIDVILFKNKRKKPCHIKKDFIYLGNYKKRFITGIQRYFKFYNTLKEYNTIYDKIFNSSSFYDIYYNCIDEDCI
ncbi:hypothetical protein TCON_1134 [Astathelohania contejeani]|uniref:Uncharacterized protein n=1 Tax=Astathelohania contejeani TaxID=164912 RepID=A0ABQ7HZM0_9MICR|nr:hypothetical protein TCON_1134 [Thelohania contejeani]